MYDSDTALQVSQAVIVAACLTLGVVLVADVVRRRRFTAWLPHLAIVPLIAGQLDARLDLLWAVAFPLLAATFPDGRFVPRWLVVPVAGYAVFGLVDIVTGG
ncbi:MAG: hypothetical protein LCH82_17835 [Actinobacteria bacterium]|nr:hypothetical protein [Actinomycetota bacterium]